MQHARHTNAFALCDVTAVPNSKIAAAVRTKAPLVGGKIPRLMAGMAGKGSHDGCASCPLTTANGKIIIIAEFI
jgi:sulfide:quinone oxidoreductase